MELEVVKKYCRIDYGDDDDLVELMIDAVLDDLEELCPNFKRGDPTARQKLLILACVKDLYDNREKYVRSGKEQMRATVRSLLLKEMLG